jgi:peroxiredoxin 2/4
MKKLVFITAIIFLTLNISPAQQSLDPLLSQNVSPPQTGLNQRIPLIGDEAPSFVAMSTNGQVSFPEDFGENWKILFAHPRNFTPVCSSEILELAYHQDEFKQLGTKVIVISTDNLDSHHLWKVALEDIKPNERESTAKIKFPMVADPTYEISNKYGMLESTISPGQNIRGVFYIDPENKIRAFQFYPNEVGRSIDELKRTLVALQTNYRDNTALLPVNWTPGDDVMVPYPESYELEISDNPESGFYRLSWFMIFRKND